MKMFSFLLAALWSLASPVWAQWLGYPDKGLPRTADGQFDVNAPTPRLPDGKPDLTGLWLTSSGVGSGSDLGTSMKEGLPVQAWVRKLVETRIERELIDDPSSRCYPTGLIGLNFVSPFRIDHNYARNRLIVLYEQNTTYRQIHLDGRPLPKTPLTTYMGYSIGRWEGDTLVVESAGFNGKSWIDAVGHPISERLHLTERISRPSFGRLENELTVDDPGAYTKPWTLRLAFSYVPDSELTESFCEDNKFVEQLESVALTPAPVVPQAPPPEEEAKQREGQPSAPPSREK